MLSLAIAQLRPRKGAYEENLEALGRVLRDAAAGPVPPDLLVAPEAALTGYFLEGGVRELAVPAERLYEDLTRVHRASGAAPVDIAIGFYEVHESRLHNSALYATLGGAAAGIRHVHRKVFLPAYGVFDEERFVEPGRTIEAFDTRWGRAAMLVCEDAWHSISGTLAALDGAQLILVPSASPARGIHPVEGESRPTSVLRWERIMQDMAGEHGVYVALAQLVGFEGGKAFAGGSLVAGPRGDLLAEGPIFEAALVPAVLDFDEITRARAEMPLLSDLEMRWPHLVGGQADGRTGGRADKRTGAPVDGQADRRTVAPTGSAVLDRLTSRPPDRPLAIDPFLTQRWLVEFIRDEVQRRRGFEKVVIGLSGGVDSSLVAYLAAEALGAENVLGVRMPYRTSSPESLAHAQLVIDALGIAHETVDITAAVDGMVAAVGCAEGASGGDVDPARKGNIMARARMIALFDLSAAHRALPLGTGNKTERLFGYFTWHADDSPPVNPIGDLFKTQVWALARHMGVPDVIVSKPASADLIRGQTDEGDFGISYLKADGILHWLLFGYRPAEVVALGYSAEEVELVRRRLESTHWKRRLPTVAMLTQTAIGEFYLRPVDY
ncbi:MAG TPA: NAD+ synthase [Gemmatimonadales bacterium]|nr:NAD+ synthase [Gemmatimonadales bacterium]